MTYQVSTEISDAQIRDRREGAASAGDNEMVQLCDDALDGCDDAREECLRCLIDYEGQLTDAQLVAYRDRGIQ